MTIFIALLALTSTAHAQSMTTGAVQGRVTDADTGEGIAGVTIWVTGPAVQQPQTGLTDETGGYKITELPPGVYIVTFYDDKVTVTRDGVHVGANDSVPVFQKIKQSQVVTVVEIHDRPPQIKIDSGELSTKLNKQYLDNMPIPGVHFDAALGTQPGAQNDGVGTAFSGSTSLENRYLVDGVDITGLTFGNIGTPVLNSFIEEIEIITGGSNAEWGRSTGGIVNVVTKSGSNTFSGSVFGNLTPGFLVAATKATPVNASSIDVTSHNAYSSDFGFELGGPIVKNKLWFYVGLAPELGRTDYTRVTKRQTDCRSVLPSGQLSECDPRLATQGGHADGAPDVDPTTGFYLTDEVDRSVLSGTTRSYSGIGKLSLALTPNNQAQASLIAVPSSSETPGLDGLPSSGSRTSGLTTDAALHWTAKLAGGHTELDALVAWHHSTFNSGSIDPTLDDTPRQVLHDGNLGTWSALGGESPKTAAGCADGGPGDPYPNITNCPMSSLAYATGGPGAISHDTEDRKLARVGITQRGHFAGSHELKAGLDIEDDTKSLARLYSGGAYIDNFVGSEIRVTRWVQLAAAGDTDPRYDQLCTTPGADGRTTNGQTFHCAYLTAGSPGTQVAGQTINWAGFLRDSWQILPNLTLNAGVRYEEQRLRYAENLRGTTDPLTGNTIGDTAMTLRGNFAPRLGVVWDPTREGASKIYASWGRFYESIPMDINDRSFGGEVSYLQSFDPRVQNGVAPCGPTDPRLGGPDGVGCLHPAGPPATEQLIGSSGVLVAPGIQAEYMDEFLAGAEYQVAKDLKIGVTYQHRVLGRVIEDVSTDGAQTYIIANPGEWSQDAETKLTEQIAATTDPTVKARLAHELSLYQGIRTFDKPSRNYDAVQLTVSRQFARGLFVQGSYTYSRTDGNYPGSISYDNGQIDPNISSQYDLIELLANRQGRLPQDRPHSLKLDAFYTFDVGKQNALTFGTRVRAISGIPENALGAHYLYGANESFLLPRGAMGRTEMEHGVDLRASYGRRLAHGMRAELFVDVFNIYNRQGTFNVDETYAPPIRTNGASSTSGTPNNVNPISGGGYEDLVWAKSIDANGNETAVPTARNPNFGKPTARYAPASAQIGFRLTF